MKGKQLKALKLKNKKLIKRYPFITPVDWYGKPMLPRRHGYMFTAWDDIPEGWRKAFGKYLAEDIDKALKADGINPRDFHFGQIKEKYGSLRMYANMSADNVDRVIDTYSQISENVCIMCGRPDVSVINTGWISPVCKQCYYKSRRKVPYEKVVCSDSKIKESYTVMRYGKSVTKEVINISETVRKIRGKRKWVD
jgi:hypothetical protein